jgi:hypothetical protein
MTTVHEALLEHRDEHPSYYVTAGHHRFSCGCPDCLTFLGLTGLDRLEDADTAAAWAELKDEECGDDYPDAWLNDDQAKRLLRLAKHSL